MWWIFKGGRSPMNNHLSNPVITPAMEWDGIAYEGGTESLRSAGGEGTPKLEQGGAAPLAGFLDSLPRCCDVLSDYQREQLAVTGRALRAGYRRIVLQAPTGSGKTHCIAAVTAGAADSGLRVLILATRTRLVRQIHDRLEEFGVAHGVVAAPLPELLDHARAVQIASADTLYRRSIAESRLPLPPAEVVIFDEAHLAGAESRLAILGSYPQALRLGFTATPARKSGRGLSAVFDVLIPGPSVLELIAAGMLVRPRIFNAPIVTASELAAVPRDKDTDYQAGALGALLSRPKLVGDVVGNWLRIANGKRTLCFAVNKAHGAQLVQEYSQAGIAAELLTDNDSESTREEVIARLECGTTQVVVNCFLMSYGVDLPTVECIVLARPTRSVAMFLQMVGRGMRPAPGKTDFLLIDHGRVVESLGLPHAPRAWSLEDGRNVNTEAREQFGRKSAEEKPRSCPECNHLWLVSEEGDACRECGWKPTPRPKAVQVEEAQLGELDYDKPASIAPHAPEVVHFFREALYWYVARWPDRWRDRPKSGRWWAWQQTREKFDFAESVRMPSAFWEWAPALTSAAVNGWLKSQLIRYAKRRRAA